VSLNWLQSKLNHANAIQKRLFTLLL